MFTGIDYTQGLIDGLLWCANSGTPAAYEEIVAKVEELEKIIEQTLAEMERGI